jgi:threonine/homoserine efflux transporter RhtA
LLIFTPIALAGLGLYLLPAIVGSIRHIDSIGALMAVNVVFGWTGIAWLACLIWAGCGQTREQVEFYRRAVIAQRAAQGPLANHGPPCQLRDCVTIEP